MDTTKSFSESFENFLKLWPSYPNSQLDELRANEYPYLEKDGAGVYVDYTGGSIFSIRQIAEYHDLLARSAPLGNPHSSNPTSLASTKLELAARATVQKYFNAPEDEYAAIFTANASGALKLVGESYPFDEKSVLLLSRDNHNSVHGIREFALAGKARARYIHSVKPDLRLDLENAKKKLAAKKGARNGLLVYPLQSNSSGVKHPLDLIKVAKSNGWDVLVDVAAYVPTNSFDMKASGADFASMSFYKMFGFPTGVGCLLARRTALAKLRRPWFGGGTVVYALTKVNKFQLRHDGSAFEDGTINYLSLPAIEIGLKHIESIGIANIANRVECLTGWLLSNLNAITHPNGRKLALLYGPADTKNRGGTIGFNLYDEDAELIPHYVVQIRANGANISLRTGCLCNPGVGEFASGMSNRELGSCAIAATVASISVTRPNLKAGTNASSTKAGAFFNCMIQHGAPTGLVRVSFGIGSNFRDAYRVLEMLKEFLNPTDVKKWVAEWRASFSPPESLC